MGIPLRVLIAEDSDDDAKLVLRALRKGDFDIEYERVASGNDLKKALDRQEWQIVVSDYRMPGFTGMDALRIVRDRGLEIPFILVSGTIGEEIAVDAISAGASDYLMKDRLTRLLPAVVRALREQKIHNERKLAESALHESENIFHHFMENSPIYIFFKDENIRSVRLSRNFEEMLGKPMKD